MQAYRKNSGFKPSFPLKIITFITVIFLVLIAFDIFPILRGPAPYPPEWQWSYLYIPTWQKIWAPLLIVFLAVILTLKIERIRTFSPQKTIIFLILIVILGIIFNASITFFSRSGLFSNIQRVIDPDNNGYFSTALTVKRTNVFLSSYDKKVLGFYQHAQGHPPGAILMHLGINNLASFLPKDIQNEVPIPKTPKIAALWNRLLSYEKTGAILSIGVILLLANLNAVVMYFIGKYLYSQKVGFRAAILTLFIPAVSFFYPLPDVYFPLFASLAFLFLILGLKEDSAFKLLLSGLTFSVGLFFSFSLLPFLIFYIFYFLLYSLKKSLSYKKALFLASIFLGAISLFYFLLYLLAGYNLFSVFTTVMSGLPENRKYLTWLFYNPYDFFIFTGIPLSGFFIYSLILIFKKISAKNTYQLIGKNMEILSFLIMLVLLVVSGNVRGEVGRIWLPFMPFIALFTAFYITRLFGKKSRKEFLLILILAAFQTVLLQEFWVLLW